MLRYHECASTGDAEGFGQLLTRVDPALVIGTAPNERTAGRDQWSAAFGQLVEAVPGLRVEAGDLQGWEEGPFGWAVDRPVWKLPGGAAMQTRLSAVLHREDGEWRLVHAHFSSGVPEEEVFELQARWGM